MAKKRKSRMSPEELSVHEQAVRLRRMSDKQLIEAFNRSTGAQAADKPANEPQGDKDASPVETLLQALSDGKCRGIGGATAYRVSQFAAELGLI